MHWFSTYFKHHLEKLGVSASSYDPCLLITNSKDQFAIVGMQTDDTLILADDKWLKLEETELIKADFKAKPRLGLSPKIQLIFNGCVLKQEEDNIMLLQKEQRKNLKTVMLESQGMHQIFVEQRARAAYIPSICQPEATFDMSVVAQHKGPDEENVNNMNKPIKWIIENIDRGLNYIPLNMRAVNVYVFVDGSLANDKDLSSQIGYVMVIANEISEENSFTIKGNTPHWSSVKSKRVTRCVLASEILTMVGGVDIGIAICSTLNLITEKLKLPRIHLVVCTDSYSLYECLVKLGSITEKRLLIDIMYLRQSYEQSELSDIRWINGLDNLADSIAKRNPNKACQAKNERISSVWINRLFASFIIFRFTRHSFV